ncbi:molybdenum cofactor biosynthesis protein [candidate division KSB3 bacterium]|uniref:Molybdenum cofactor biosynthesis protein B n=1 Tax=candidate division KSB3 bacterium TaxID=2044937 RepID=A0A2G6E292_9BACT|nr:MAG: molybdenum cofactor biosynthesis protein [candidate division KSB3 bacterium]PIE28742.1 MAG: molybdenum cofactor biosynthesis protein [candidate division KSB3 bacterium]
MGHEEYTRQAAKKAACMVITISDTRTDESDTSGRLIIKLLEHNGHRRVKKHIVPDEPQDIRALLQDGIASDEIQVILCHGGTGISARDRSYEAIDAVLEKRLTGFGELFRMLSYQEIGPTAMMSRATAGISAGTIIFSMPGSKAAVKLAMEKLILPELSHLLWELGKHSG